ncbi:MAG: PorT family protein [Bacteroidales bacterium]|nr:PorT family protein [Bacteroidales bacterium]
MTVNRCYSLFILILVFFIPGWLVSQEFNGGILAGMCGSEISGDRLEGPNKAGIYAGGFVNIYITEKSSFQMELDYIQKGSRDNPDSLSYESYLLRLNYIELPVHYKYDFRERWTLETGLSYGVLISKYEEVNTIEQVNAYPEFKNGDLSFNIGMFYSLTDRLRLNIRYSNSIRAVRPHSGGQTYKWNQGQYNEVLSFTLHFDL